MAKYIQCTFDEASITELIDEVLKENKTNRESFFKDNGVSKFMKPINLLSRVADKYSLKLKVRIEY